MTDDSEQPAGAAQLLAELAARLGEPVGTAWSAAFRSVPRHLFLPDVLWLRDGRGGYNACRRAEDPKAWHEAAYSDMPLVTQMDSDADGYQVPTSSASAPSTVLRMLMAADIREGMRVLEIGSGTGFHAGLLAALLGSEHVTSVEVDPRLAHSARTNLGRAGLSPAVHCCDGFLGYPDDAPYDCVIATCSVRSVPPAWLEQTRTGGRIIAPWDTAWLCFGTLVLTRRDDGTADGRFAAHGSYMAMRGQRPHMELHRDVLRPGQEPEVTSAAVSPWAVAGNDLDALFAIGLAVPGVWHSWDPHSDVDGVHTRLWLADEDATSWAAVDYDGHRTDTFRVSQYGPRHLWDEVARAHQEWLRAGSPTIGQYSVTVTADGAASIPITYGLTGDHSPGS